jgi:hypothetical protein
MPRQGKTAQSFQDEETRTHMSPTLHRFGVRIGTRDGPGKGRDGELRFAVDPMHFDQPWRIHWKPESRLYPEFEGELTVRADETYETSHLELPGSYHPPGGIAGAAFDLVAGGRIASATAQALLHRIGNEMEAHYQHDERTKRDQTT